jgi:hypothetical protein
MSYFNRFPMMAYDMKNDGNFKLLPDILRRVKQRNAIASGQFVFDTYDVQEGEKPEDIAYKWFGDAELHWVILMTNNITDRFHQWPMTQPQFQAFMEDKYDNSDGIHHYEITKTSGNTTSNGPGDYSHLVECNSDEVGALSISNREYEERQQDNRRQIKLLNQRYLTDFLTEFDSLIKSQ